ncbi:unnamed protein product [Rangifer tarandus platyrhynchus]|uniref:Uncharacterized protein n=2 Tax=Rangifer tarandus platyrhynchus TaxID=3082113 RepID=A0ACB0E5W6_RANTA|nr:unnamed protein product [Rangifer tarandus platyrhynchus]CAI9695829.1 unnamed protein product [Rangifer tarandus platyrhynchus]
MAAPADVTGGCGTACAGRARRAPEAAGRDPGAGEWAGARACGEGAPSRAPGTPPAFAEPGLKVDIGKASTNRGSLGLAKANPDPSGAAPTAPQTPLSSE